MSGNTSKELIKKYNRPAPRYTSYPTVPSWSQGPTPEQWLKSIATSSNVDGGVDLYLHIPFCVQLCWYCGCNRVISKDLDKGEVYIEYLLKEWGMYKAANRNLKIDSIHFGGGTPNFLTGKVLDKLLAAFEPDINSDFLGSVEVDPRTLSDGHLATFQKYGFKRISMGIQDFDIDVQRSINRIQSYELVQPLIKKISDFGFTSINFDLIYGLPKQTIASIEDTIEKVKTLRPDMIAFYSYAHLPESLKNQKLINESELPVATEKRALYDRGRELLFEAGYVEIGLDHFTLKDSYLGKAFQARKLKRNFMGYTDKKSACLLGLGVSSISNTPEYFSQNEKDVKSYYQALDKDLLPLTKGHTLSEDDRVVSEVIQELMCNQFVNLEVMKDFSYFPQVESEIAELIADKLVEYEDWNLTVTELGQTFLRNIALVFDSYLRNRESKTKFSQTI